MKKYLLIILVAFSTVLFSSCDSWVDSNINIDPNNPVDAPLNLVLPVAEVSYAYVVGGDFSRFTGMWIQNFTGIDRQFDVLNNYQFTESDGDNAWSTTYQVCLNNLKIVSEKATESNSPHYRGIAKVMMAATMGQVADLWGDAPMSEALLGNANLKPKYDKADAIYASIQTMLNEAITDLGSATSTFKPDASSDIIHGGDVSKWIKTAHALKARYAWRLSKVDQSKAASAALQSIALAMGSEADDAMVNFAEDPTAENPLSQFLSQRSGYMTIGTRLVDIMNGLEDPRRDAYIAADKAGKFTVDCDPGPLYASAASPVPVITYAEMMMIRAEIKLAEGSDADAKQSYTNAIKSSMKAAGVSDVEVTTYLAKPEVMPTGNLTLDNIMTQKYIALYTQPESFCDWRKTGIPSITPPKFASGLTPRRFIYPISERIYNSANMPTGITTQSKIFWDK